MLGKEIGFKILQVALEGKEVIFALNAKGSFLLTMC